MNGCGKDITIVVPARLNYKIIETTCGATSIDGKKCLCDECERKQMFKEAEDERERG